MNWPAHDAPTSRCDRCGRRHGFEGCPNSRVNPYITGPNAAGPHTSGSTPRVSPQSHPGHGPATGWPTGQHLSYTPTLPSGSQPIYRPPTGSQPTYRQPPAGSPPGYSPTSTGQQTSYRYPSGYPASGPQPAYRPPASGSQPTYRYPYPSPGPQAGFRLPPSTGSQSVYRDPTTGSQPVYRDPSTGSQPVYRDPTTGSQPAYRGSGASPLDWTGQLGGWSQGVAARVPLDTVDTVDSVGTIGRTDPWPEGLDERIHREQRERNDLGAWPERTDHLWPSVTTDPFGMNAQAAVRAEKRERSRTASFGFQLHMHTPRRARRHTVEFASYWGLDHLVEAAELVVSELMTNALEASLPGLGRQGVSMAVAPLELRLSAEGRHLRIEIRDHNPDPPVLEEPDVEEERGRGLILVDSYCEVWGYHRLPTGGKVVWCLIGPPADA